MVVVVVVLLFLSFDIVGLGDRNDIQLIKLLTLIPKGSLPEQMEDEK